MLIYIVNYLKVTKIVDGNLLKKSFFKSEKIVDVNLYSKLFKSEKIVDVNLYSKLL